MWDERSMWEAAGKLLEFSALSIGVARGREGRWLFPRFWLPSLPFFFVHRLPFFIRLPQKSQEDKKITLSS